ncbi:MAG: hypothetical protein RL030_832 [Pseudomonadota bacterium]
MWTAGATAGALLQVPGMDAAILARPVPVDLDGDGWHDRIYAADVAGRIWRLDLVNGAERERWANARMLADLSGGGIRGFLTAPDIALHDAHGQNPWLSISLGSVSLEGQPEENRFYVLRDSVENTARDDERLRDYFVTLGAGQVLAPSLTIGGNVVFTVAQMTTRQVGGCAAIAEGRAARIEVHAIAAHDGTPALDLNVDGTVNEQDAILSLEGARPADSALHMASKDDADRPGQRNCLVGNDPIPGCTLDTRLRRRYWLREDAD